MSDNFNRVMFKEQAKNVLRHNYWIPFLVCLIASVFGVFGGGAGGSAGGGGGSAGNSYSESTSGSEMDWNFILIMIAIVLIVTLVLFAIGMAVTCFLTNPVLVGMNRYFMKHRKMDDTSSVGDLFSVFRKNQYMDAVKTMFLYRIKIFLWSLLFIIPGIIKSYEYYFVPYIMAENPNIDSKRAFEISKFMTDGHKFDIWVVGLSFLGWTLLGILCCGVGTYFLLPYMQATYAEMYAERREYAIGQGFTSASELTGF